MADFELNKDVSEFLNLKSENLDDFKEQFEKDFVRIDKLGGRKDLLKPHFGKTLGELETKLRGKARDFGVDLSKDGIPEGTKTEEVIDILFTKAAELRDTQVTEWKDKAGNTDDEALTKLQSEFDTFKETQGKKYTDLEGLKEDAVTKFNDLEKTSTEKFTQIKIDTLQSEAHNKVKWARESEGFELKYKGFKAQLNESYKTSLTDDGTFVVTDNKGERIKDEKVTGEFKSYDKILNEEAEKAGLLKVNPNGGQKVPQTGFTPPPAAGTPPANGQPTRTINRATR